MNEFTQHRQCQTCLAQFASNDKLTLHLEGYQSHERWLMAELEKCRAHSSSICEVQEDACGARDDDDKCTGNENDIGSRISLGTVALESPDGFTCPHDECGRDAPFATRQRLRRHFQKHVRCKEVCVYCFEVFTLASQYIAHSVKHKDEDRVKDSYTNKVCDYLRKRVEEDLDTLVSGRQTEPNRRKRKREGSTSQGPSSATRANVDVSTHAPNTAVTEGVAYSLPSVQPFHPPQPVGIGDFHRLPPQPFGPLEEESYGAPLFSILTFPPGQAGQYLPTPEAAGVWGSSFSNEIGPYQDE